MFAGPVVREIRGEVYMGTSMVHPEEFMRVREKETIPLRQSVMGSVGGTWVSRRGRGMGGQDGLRADADAW